MPPLFKLENVKQIYGRRSVVDVEQLELHKGEILGIYGPNGSGKSTLLKMLAFLEAPAQGKIFFEGKMAGVNDLQVRRQVTLLSQSPYLLKRSVISNVSYGLKIRGMGRKRKKTREALAMVGLDPREFSDRMWYELSGGEAQRLALAARLVIEPKALLLDEPTAYLDEESSEKIRSAALFAKQKWNTALILVSHDYGWLDSVCERILFMRRGSLYSKPVNSNISRP